MPQTPSRRAAKPAASAASAVSSVAVAAPAATTGRSAGSAQASRRASSKSTAAASAAKLEQPALLRAKPIPKPPLTAMRGFGVSAGFGSSVVIHAFVLLFLGISMPDGGARKETPHLDVVLVNAKHKQAPRNVQALAQANMDGGGNTDSKDLPTTPLPPEHTDQAGDAIQDAKRRNEALEAQTRALLAQAQAMAAIEQATGKRADDQAQRETPKPGDAPEDKTRAMAKQEAVVDKLLRQYASRPRKTVISPRTKESAFALYTIAWRKVVEDLGSLKFPKGADGQAMYGSVMLSVEIDRKGRLVDATVERSSGNKRLDEAALRIVRMASPFKPLPAETARDTDILVMVETFRFQKVLGDSSLEVKNGAQ